MNERCARARGSTVMLRTRLLVLCALLLLLLPPPCAPRRRSRQRNLDRRTGHQQESHRHHRDKYIIFLTGPLNFGPKCRVQFHRLYHNTRDCTTPGYYKRCARLLTQLAKSPRCTER